MNKTLLNRFLKYWIKQLDLGEYKIECKIEEPNKTSKSLSQSWTVHKSEVACIIVLPEEKKATIVFNKDRFRETKEDSIVHELVHIILADIDWYIFDKTRSLKKYNKYVEKYLEVCVDKITKILMRSRRGRR